MLTAHLKKKNFVLFGIKTSSHTSEAGENDEKREGEGSRKRGEWGDLKKDPC